MQKDYFKKRANNYDDVNYRLHYVKDMAKVIMNNINLNKNMHILDFGAGTGLLTEQIAFSVSKITAVDISTSMISKLEKKSDSIPCQLNLIQKDLTQETLSLEVDGIISTMTLHHIENVPKLFKNFFKLVKLGGFVAFCDIDKEDGSFHTLDTGVKHLGFDRDEISSWLKDAGFGDVACYDATIINKPYGSYSAFLLLGYRPTL